MFPRHFERIDWRPNSYTPPDLTSWPYTIPAVAQLVTEGGMDVPPGVTFLVGENGSGKSTLIEAFAQIYPRRGHEVASGAVTGPSPSSEDSDLARHLRPKLHRFASPAGFFLRAEAMHTFLTSVDENPREARSWGGEQLLRQSHGESFIQWRSFLQEPKRYLKHLFENRGTVDDG